MGFLDNLSQKASETYRNTAEKTNKLTREMKLKSLINEDKNKIQKIYAEIGKKVYEKHIREENIDIKSELMEECSKIDAYSREIEDMNMEMLALKNLRLCKKCASEIAITAKFCPKCGAQQETIPQTEQAKNVTVQVNETNANENETESKTEVEYVEYNESQNIENNSSDTQIQDNEASSSDNNTQSNEEYNTDNNTQNNEENTNNN